VYDPKVYKSTYQFAKLVGSTPPSVRHAIKVGRIEAVVDGKKFLVHINQKQKFIKTMNPAKSKQGMQALQDAILGEQQITQSKRGSKSAKDYQGVDPNLDEINVANAPLMERVFKAKKARLEYLRTKEELIPAETVAAEWADIAQGVLSSLLSIPDRVAPMMEGMDHHEIHNTLVKEIKHACQQLSDSLRESSTPRS
jgi:phage terminase Nu1 subunit (DNA packaging protein)